MPENTLAPFGLVAVLLLTPACRGPADGNDAAIKTDLEFLDQIVRHHELAIAMADISLERGESPQVQRVAWAVKFHQQEDIDWLTAARGLLTGSDRPDVESPSQDSDLALLQTAPAADIDRLFLLHMIAHHASAIQMAHEALPELKVVAVKAIAVKILQDEPAEIGMMQDTLAEIM